MGFLLKDLTTMPLLEENVSKAILEHKSEIIICRRKYTVTPPTPATLIMASAYCAKLPKMNPYGNIVTEILLHAKDAEAIGKVVAVLILGAKRINQNRKIRTGIFRKRNEFEWLSQYLMENMTIKDVAKVIAQRLTEMQIGDFFGLTTSLSAVNITKATKEVGTQSGG